MFHVWAWGRRDTFKRESVVGPSPFNLEQMLRGGSQERYRPVWGHYRRDCMEPVAMGSAHGTLAVAPASKTFDGWCTVALLGFGFT